MRNTQLLWILALTAASIAPALANGGGNPHSPQSFSTQGPDGGLGRRGGGGNRGGGDHGGGPQHSQGGGNRGGGNQGGGQQHDQGLGRGGNRGGGQQHDQGRGNQGGYQGGGQQHDHGLGRGGNQGGYRGGGQQHDQGRGNQGGYQGGGQQHDQGLGRGGNQGGYHGGGQQQDQGLGRGGNQGGYHGGGQQHDQGFGRAVGNPHIFAPVRNGRFVTHTNYGENNNRRAEGLGRPVRYESVPRAALNVNLSILVNRQDRLRVFGSNYRVGYYGYSREFNDDVFCYPHYVFNPYYAPACVSPWYFYACLPGYISPSVVFQVSFGERPHDFEGRPYYWDGNDYNNDSYDIGYNDGYRAAQNRPLNRALDEIRDVFQRGDNRALNDLIDDDQNVGIYIDGRYQYSMHGEDVYNLLRDNANAVQTQRYEIVSVRTDGREAKVLAKQIYRDPWGDEQAVYQTFRLHITDGGAYIEEFGTSAQRPW